MKQLRRAAGLILILLPVLWAGPVKFAGARSSIYGVHPFPSAEAWTNIMYNVAAPFPGAVPTGVWIVGTIGQGGECNLEFPSAGKSYPHVNFSDEDRHEACLSHFDKVGIKVYLQVEAGLASIDDCIDAVLGRYGSHPCVAGFGLDVEWYASSGETNATVAVTAAQVKAWDERIKKVNPNFRLFAKHWENGMCGERSVSNVVYVNDGQQFGSLDEIVSSFYDWATAYYPNAVMYQVGYPDDRPWWSGLSDPVKDIGTAISRKVPNNQQVGIIWVDFSIDDTLLHLYRSANNAVRPTGYRIGTAGRLELTPAATGVTIRYTGLDAGRPTGLKIYNLRGVALFTAEPRAATGELFWPAASRAPGSYIVQLTNGRDGAGQRLMLVR
jgi:hypothetical protein